MSTLLEVRNVTKVFQQAGKSKTALKNVSFRRGRGCTALLGYNGSGKSTLLNLILGIILPDQGEIYVEGKSPTHYPGLASFPLFPWYDPRMTVRDFIWALEMFFDTDVKDKHIRLLELENYLDVQLQKLSSGYQMRLRLLSSLVQPSRVVLLDELTNGLDLETVNTFTRVINRVKRRRSVIFATHIFDHAEAVADDILVLHRGRLLFDGSRKRFVKKARPMVLIRGENVKLGRKRKDYNMVEIDDPEKDLPKLLEAIKKAGGRIEEVRLVRPGFKSAFLEVLEDENH